MEGTSMRSKPIRAALAGIIALLGLALPSCGGGDNESASETAAKFPAPPLTARSARAGLCKPGPIRYKSVPPSTCLDEARACGGARLVSESWRGAPREV